MSTEDESDGKHRQIRQKALTKSEMGTFTTTILYSLSGCILLNKPTSSLQMQFTGCDVFKN